MSVFVIDKDDNPLMPCSEKRAHQLLDKKQAVAVRMHPFVIKLLDFVPTTSSSESLRLKIDPGAKITGLALLDNSNVVWLGELHHRTNISIKLSDRSSIRRGRRSRNTRYRAARFDNRSRPTGWLAPSLESRVNQIMSAISKLRKYVPISAISLELVKFDMQKMENPEISGTKYQQGELFGYEVRAYLQEKFGHKCAYCGKADYDNHNLKFEVEHITPRTRGGTDRISNLAWSCEPCNKKKGRLTADEYGFPDVVARAKASLKDAAAVNSTRYRLLTRLQETGLEIETGTGGMTKMNRTRLGLPKAHCIDAVCVGTSAPDQITSLPKYFDIWKAVGRGNRQVMQPDSFGFPKQFRSRVKRKCGFATGDIVCIADGKNKGIRGRLTARAGTPYIIVLGKRVSCAYKNLALIQQSDGWDYSKQKL